MKKNFLLILMTSLLIVSCGGGGGGSSSGESSVDAASADASDSDVDTVAGMLPNPSTGSTLPALALSFGSNINMMGFTSSQEDKYNEAISIVKKVMGTEAFRKRVLNHVYNGSKQYADNGGKSNAQIYQSLLEAAEKLQPAKNNKMDLGVKMYYEDSTVVGYTMASITYINVNTKFFNQYDANEVAGNLFHEWLHKLGYGHDASVTAKRPYSVPYAIGYMIRDLGKNFL